MKTPRISAAIARLRNKSTKTWTPEGDTGDVWTPVKRGVGVGQRRGRIYAATRNEHFAVQGDHQNRAGHRLYVKERQPRQVRKNIVGFGRWRRHNESSEESFALQTAIPPMPPRAARRAEMIAVDRASRRTRGRRITP